MMSIILAAQAAATQVDFAAVLSAIAGFIIWVLTQAQAHPEQVAQMFLVTIPALAIAIKSSQWHTVLKLAGDLAFQAAQIAELDKADKKAWVKARLKQALPPVVRPFFSDKTLDAAVEYGWHVIAKRNVLPAKVEEPSEKPNADQ